jgi:hypothetical protein
MELFYMQTRVKELVKHSVKKPFQTTMLLWFVKPLLPLAKAGLAPDRAFPSVAQAS